MRVHMQGLRGAWHRLWAMLVLQETLGDAADGIDDVRAQVSQALGRPITNDEFARLAEHAKAFANPGGKAQTDQAEGQHVRHFSGVFVDGHQIAVALVPNAYGNVTVRVLGYPSLTGFPDRTWLGNSEASSEFAAGGIKVDGLTLECFSTPDYAPIYREGFKVLLEPGMGEKISLALPKLERIAVVSAAIERRFNVLMGDTPYAHATDFICEVVASIVLDGHSVQAALAKAKLNHWAGKDDKLMSVFNDEQVDHLMETAAFAELHYHGRTG